MMRVLFPSAAAVLMVGSLLAPAVAGTEAHNDDASDPFEAKEHHEGREVAGSQPTVADPDSAGFAPSDESGAPLTDAEIAELESRMKYSQEVHEEVIPRAESLPGYGGAYFEEGEEGFGLVVQFQGAPDERAEALAGIDDSDLQYEIRYVEHSLDSLLAAQGRVIDAQDPVNLGPGGPLSSVDVVSTHADEVAGLLRVGVLEGQQGHVDGESLNEELGVEVLVHGDVVPSEQQDCVGREQCNPIPAGAVIRSASASGLRCTMAFHVDQNGDAQYLTAGHCGADGGTFVNFFHAGYSTSSELGRGLATLYEEGGMDARRVQFPDSQATTAIYGETTRPLASIRNPTTFEPICASLGVSNEVQCGNVEAVNTTWTGDACECTMLGARHSLSTMDGDSGSPIYVRNESTATGVGIHSTGGGNFAMLFSVMDGLGVGRYG